MTGAAVAAGLSAGMVVGALNGIAVAVLGLPPVKR